MFRFERAQPRTRREAAGLSSPTGPEFFVMNSFHALCKFWQNHLRFPLLLGKCKQPWLDASCYFINGTVHI